MKKGYNIESSEWCDIVFKNKNKSYGAYALRQSSAKRHIVALGVTVIAMAFVSLLPQLIGAVKDFNRGNTITSIEEVVVSQIEVNNKLPEEKIIHQELAPPPPPIIASVKFTPPVIIDDDKFKEEEGWTSMDELNSTTIRISSDNIKSDVTVGLAIDELKKRQIIVGDDEPKEDPPHISVEVMPQFPGGEADMYAFISKNLKYPVPAQESGIQGKVIIRFVVTSSGDISNVEVLRGIDQACDKEAVRVVKMMPKWIPGKQNGRNVPVYFTLPVVYRLQ